MLRNAVINLTQEGNVDSTVRIAEQGLPIVYATIGGNPKAFRQLVRIYKEIGRRHGHDLNKMKVAAHSWGWIEEDRQAAVDHYFFATKQTVDNIAKDRPHWQEMTKAQYLQSVGPEGAIFVGDPQTVAQKIIKIIEDLELDRFMLHLPIGSMPHEATLNAIRLYGQEVAPIVRKHFEAK